MRRITLAIITLACTLTLPTGQVQAQFPLTIVAGPTISTVSADGYDTSSKTGFFVAAGTALPLNETVALLPFVGYVQKGAKFDGGTASYDYIEIPVQLGVQFPLNERLDLGLSAGPQVSFNVNCDEDGYDCSQYDDFKSTEFGILFGGSLGFPLTEQLGGSIGADYDLGLTDLFDSEGSFKNRVLYLWVSVTAMIGG